MTTYPRIIKLDNSKLKKLIETKEDLVLQGRRMSQEIGLIHEAQENINKKLVEEERAVDVSDLLTEFEAKKAEAVEILHKAYAIEKRILDRIREKTPQELRDQYDQLEKQKEAKELELNKIGHKVQKAKDKIVPLVQELGKEYLTDEWEDFNTTKLDEDGTPVLEIFSHLEELRATLQSKK